MFTPKRFALITLISGLISGGILVGRHVYNDYVERNEPVRAVIPLVGKETVWYYGYDRNQDGKIEEIRSGDGRRYLEGSEKFKEIYPLMEEKGFDLKTRNTV